MCCTPAQARPTLPATAARPCGPRPGASPSPTTPAPAATAASPANRLARRRHPAASPPAALRYDQETASPGRLHLAPVQPPRPVHQVRTGPGLHPASRRTGRPAERENARPRPRRRHEDHRRTAAFVTPQRRDRHPRARHFQQRRRQVPHAQATATQNSSESRIAHRITDLPGQFATARSSAGDGSPYPCSRRHRRCRNTQPTP